MMARSIDGRLTGARFARLRRLGPMLVVAIAAVIIIPPVLWMLKTSLTREHAVIRVPIQWVPDPVSGGNYQTVFDTAFPTFIKNTLILAFGSIFVTFAVGIPAAYAATRLSFRGRESLLFSFLAISLIPGVTILVAIFGFAIENEFLDNYALIIVVYSGVVTGQSVWFMRAFIENVPREIEEAAFVDGANRWQTLTRVTLPLIRPGLASVALFIFVFVWNDFLVGAFLTSDADKATVQMGLVFYNNADTGANKGAFMAYATMAFGPILILFMALQRWFIAGLTAGGTKG